MNNEKPLLTLGETLICIAIVVIIFIIASIAFAVLQETAVANNLLVACQTAVTTSN